LGADNGASRAANREQPMTGSFVLQQSGPRMSATGDYRT
jgi:hypothetical protein